MSLLLAWIALMRGLFFIPQSIPFPGPGMPASAGGGGPVVTTFSCQGLGTNGGTTTGVTTTGNFVALRIGFAGAATLTGVSDNKGNTYTALTVSAAQNSTKTIEYYAENATTGAGHTFTVTGTNAFPAVCPISITSMVTSGSLDTGTDQIDTTFTSTTCKTVSISPSAGKKVVIFGFSWEATSGTSTVDSSVLPSPPTQIPFVGGTNYGAGVGYVIQTPNGVTIQPTVTTPASGFPDCTIAAFKAM